MSEELIADLAVQVESHLISPTAALRKLEAAVLALQVAAASADSREAFEAAYSDFKAKHITGESSLIRRIAESFWQAAMASKPSDTPTGFDAEFLSKRLARVAALVGYQMPDMSHEDTAAVAGTILGAIAGIMARSQKPSDAQIRDAALEEAAKAAESHSLAEQLARLTMANPVTHSLNLCRAIAITIRAIKTAKGEQA